VAKKGERTCQQTWQQLQFRGDHCVPLRYGRDLASRKKYSVSAQKLATVLEKRDCIVLIAMWNPELGIKN
jgi:hypothetical protein